MVMRVICFQTYKIYFSFLENVYLKHAVENLQAKNVPAVVAENILDKLDFRSPEFAEGIKELAKVLNVVCHPDPLVTLKAVRKVVIQRMSPDCVEHPEKYVLKVCIQKTYYEVFFYIL
uniref:Uncharacterized protein E02H1.5-like n=1 Tax=Diabrotica virgifera virgifera TaxID=50390 RepID=A0A6P7FQH5_DIAVI